MQSHTCAPQSVQLPVELVTSVNSAAYHSCAWHLAHLRLHAGLTVNLTEREVLQGFEGLADSIVGAVTVFWYALLTDRAFQMMPTNWAGKKLKCVAVMWNMFERLLGGTYVHVHRHFI
jgi:hypothetical protein